MADSPTPAEPSFVGPKPIEALVIRPWPKIILMLPTLFAALICGILMLWYQMPTAEANATFGAVQHYIGLFFLVVLAVNLTMLLYDLSLKGFILVTLLIAVLILVLALINRSAETSIWAIIGRFLSVRVVANDRFYFLFAMVLLFNLGIAWIITRFNYWKVEHNEIIIHRGFMHEQERHPTAQARFKLVIEDVVEYAILGTGKLVFYFGDSNTQHELSTVLFVHRKAKKLDELLGRLAVTQTAPTES
ncbi:MAG TPA: hypothetical protein PLL20_10640 [Phycisphaerae bacterium]|nr:hypothetical protein [Phycisphaerae bacterium]HRR84532.1 hypothetical protein [Phycisphaerae bacterium]